MEVFIARVWNIYFVSAFSCIIKSEKCTRCMDFFSHWEHKWQQSGEWMQLQNILHSESIWSVIMHLLIIYSISPNGRQLIGVHAVIICTFFCSLDSALQLIPFDIKWWITAPSLGFHSSTGKTLCEIRLNVSPWITNSSNVNWTFTQKTSHVTQSWLQAVIQIEVIQRRWRRYQGLVWRHDWFAKVRFILNFHSRKLEQDLQMISWMDKAKTWLLMKSILFHVMLD